MLPINTVYVYYRDKFRLKLVNYENARRTASRIEIEKLVNILRGEDEARFEQVFEEKSFLLPDFLEAAEERRRNGTEEKPRKFGIQKKRSRDEDNMMEDEDDEEQQQEEEEEEPERKRPHVEEFAFEQEHQPDEMDFQEQEVARYENAQQVARDMHSWR